MLHPVPDSSLRRRLMRIVVIQRKLVRALCALPAGSTVDQEWLSSTAWPRVDADWIRRFWENENGRRQAWLNTIAAANASAKRELNEIMDEQHRFKKLYCIPPEHRLRQTDSTFWKATPVRKAMRHLMLDFYNPWFYESAGYPSTLHGGGDVLKRKHLARDPLLPVCPFSDGTMQRPQLDHFLPKESFPFICLHPDNLIPSSSDANMNKSTVLPLDWTAAHQTSKWFHPRWRSAPDRFLLRFDEKSDRLLTLKFEAVDAIEKERVANLDKMFGLTKFWGTTLDVDIQNVQKEVADLLRDDDISATENSVRKQLEKLHRQYARRAGYRPKHIYYAALYEFVLNTNSLITDIIKQYQEDALKHEALAE